MSGNSWEKNFFGNTCSNCPKQIQIKSCLLLTHAYWSLSIPLPTALASSHGFSNQFESGVASICGCVPWILSSSTHRSIFGVTEIRTGDFWKLALNHSYTSPQVPLQAYPRKSEPLHSTLHYPDTFSCLAQPAQNFDYTCTWLQIQENFQ